MTELITDRTRTDVLLRTQKGRYRAEDLNRVEGAVSELMQLAEKLDVLSHLQVKTDWTFPEQFDPQQWPTKEQMSRYLGNVSTLCAAVGVAAELPVSMEHLTWEGANQIEQALLGVYERIEAVLQTFQFSGELFAGEEEGA